MFALIAALAFSAPALAAEGQKVSRLARRVAYLAADIVQTAQFNISPVADENLCLSVVSDGHNGAGLKLANCTEGTGVAYTYNLDNGGLKSDIDGDYCIDIKDGTQHNGNPIQHWKCVDYSPNQIFDFVEIEGKEATYEIKWTNTDYCFDVKDGNHTAGADVQIWRCVPSNTNQMWIVQSVNDADCDGTTDGSMEQYTKDLEAAKKEQKRGLNGHRRRTIF